MPTPPYPVTSNADKTKEYVTVNGVKYDPIPGTKDKVPPDRALLEMALYLSATGRLDRSWVEDIQSKKASLTEKQNLVGVYEEDVAPLTGIGKLPPVGIENPAKNLGTAIGSVTDFLKLLVDPNIWLRVAEVLVGVILLGVGIAKVSTTGAKIVNATPIGKLT